MKTTLKPDELRNYVAKILENYFPDKLSSQLPTQDAIGIALSNVQRSFTYIRKKYYNKTNECRFNHLNSDHMIMLIYFLSRYYATLEKNIVAASKFFYLNKILHGVDIFYEVHLPKVFYFVHPLGTVVGKATFSEFIVIYQNVTIGAHNSLYPSMGSGLVLYPGTRIIGNCKVGDNVVFGANAFIINTDVPSNTVVTGQYPNYRFTSNKINVRSAFFDS